MLQCHVEWLGRVCPALLPNGYKCTVHHRFLFLVTISPPRHPRSSRVTFDRDRNEGWLLMEVDVFPRVGRHPIVLQSYTVPRSGTLQYELMPSRP
jgi:hypothetical protein